MTTVIPMLQTERGQLLTKLRERLGLAGPERFDLGQYISETEDDEQDPHGRIGELRYYEQTAADHEFFVKVDDSLKFGSCGRVACLAGHGAMVWFEEHGQLIDWHTAMEKLGLGENVCGSDVDSSHPYSDLYDTLLRSGIEQQTGQWLVSLLVLNDEIVKEHTIAARKRADFAAINVDGDDSGTD